MSAVITMAEPSSKQGFVSGEQVAPSTKYPIDSDHLMATLIDFGTSEAKRELCISGRLSGIFRSDNKQLLQIVQKHQDTFEGSSIATMAIDTTTTPFENLMRTVRVLDSYLHVIEVGQKSMKIGPSSQCMEYLCCDRSCTKIHQHWYTISDSELLSSIGQWWALANLGMLEKMLKHYTATLLARALNQVELPDQPSWHFEFKHLSCVFDSQNFRRWWKTHLVQKKRSSKFVAFAYSFYMGKNGSLAPSRGFIEAALNKHKNLLCGLDAKGEISQKDNHFTDDNDGDRLRDLIVSSIIRTVKEIFPKVRSEHPAPSKTASLGASFNRPRAGGGAFGEIHHAIHGVKREMVEDEQGSRAIYYRFSGERTFLGYATHPKKDYLVEAVYGTCDPDDAKWCEETSYHYAISGTSRSSLFDKAEIRQECLVFLNNYVAEGGDLSVYFLGDIDPMAEFMSLSLCPLIPATVVPLLEAFKVRTITKGDAHQYHLCRRWQTEIWGRLHNFPSARLTGEPCSAQILSEMITSHPLTRESAKNGFFVSGDYESATDLLNPELSQICQYEIGKRLGIPLQDQIVLNKALTNHYLVYGKKGGLITEAYRQIWGQLMGSPVSFPVLCIINLAATRLSFEIAHNRLFDLVELPMVVNGDDVLFRAKDSQHYQIWKQITAECGLKFSLGKNYTSQRFMVINSELYRVTRSYKVKRMPQLNVRLLYGGTRSSATGLDLRPCDSQKSYASLPVGSSKFCWKSRYFALNDKDSWDEVRLKDAKMSARFPDPMEFAVAYFMKINRHNYFMNRGLRFQLYGRWFETVPQRLQCFEKQLHGDYVQPGVFEAGVALHEFSQAQICRYKIFKDEFARAKVEIPYYLPRCVGGLGLPPPSKYEYSLLDSALVQTLRECDLETREHYLSVISSRPARSDLMVRATGEVTRIQKIFELNAEPVPIPEWDEHLERHGAPEVAFTRTVIQGFSDLALHADTEDYLLDYEEKWNIRGRSGIALYRKVTQDARARVARWKSEGGVPDVLDLNKSLESRVAEFNVRYYRQVPRLP